MKKFSLFASEKPVISKVGYRPTGKPFVDILHGLREK
jgi:hypothetical protein